MIEVYDIKDVEPEKLDITPELALAAYNTLIQFCTKQSADSEGCEGCVLLKDEKGFRAAPSYIQLQSLMRGGD